MQKLFSQLFRRSRSSSSSKRSSYRGSQTSVNENNSRRSGGSSSFNMRSAASEHNIDFPIDYKDLDKHKLHRAAFDGDINKVMQHARPNLIDQRDKMSRTPLMYAVARGHSEVVKYLIQEGARSDIVDQGKRTPLMLSIIYGDQNDRIHAEMQETLLVESANNTINFTDEHGRSALHYAVERGDEQLVQRLLSLRRINPNLRDVFQATPLHLAASTGNARIVSLLLTSRLDTPCDPNLTDKDNLTPYQRAQYNNQESCMRILAERMQPMHSDNSNSALLPGPGAGTVVTSRILDQNPDDDTDEHSSAQSNVSSAASEGEVRVGLNDSVEPQSGTGTIGAMARTNPIQPEPRQKSPSPRTGPSRLQFLMNNNPIKPVNSTSSAITNQATSKQPFPSSMSSNNETETQSNSWSATKMLLDANPVTGSNLISNQAKGPTNNPTISNLPRGDARDTLDNSWSQTSHPSTSQLNQSIRPAQKVPESWTSSSGSSDSDDSDDDTLQKKKPNIPMVSPQQTTAFGSLNGTSMFMPNPANDSKIDDDDQDDDSIETAVRVDKSTNYGLAQDSSKTPQSQIYSVQKSQLPHNIPSSISDESSYSTSSALPKQSIPNPTISALVQNQPLTNKRTNELALDDSRPLSADLKNTITRKPSNSSTSSFDGVTYESNKPRTENQVPTGTNSVLSALVMKNLKPMDSEGKENLTNRLSNMGRSDSAMERRSSSSSTTGRLLISPMPQRNDSLSSSNPSSFVDERNQEKGKMTGQLQPSSNYHIDEQEHAYQNWPRNSLEQNESKGLQTKYATDPMSSSQRLASRTPLNRDFSGLRGSMSSSTSSIQNNMDRLTEIKEDINKIERQQVDLFDLRRQLKEMEIRKNNIESMFKKQEEILRSTEAKLEKETSEKQRLEWNSKSLIMELKTVKERLQTFEDDREILNQRYLKLKEERDSLDERVRAHHNNQSQITATALLREEDIEKIKSRHREEMKLLSAENDELHQRTKELQSDLQLHRESLDVTIRYKIDLEAALDEKKLLQHQMDRLKQEKEAVEQERIEIKMKYDSLQEEIHQISSDRSKIEQKLANELQDQIKQRQRSSEDAKKYKTQIEQLNIKLGDAEARLLVLQTQNEALLASKDRQIKDEFETLSHRLNMIESEKLNAEQRYHTEHREIINKQLHQHHGSQDPLAIVTSTQSANGSHSHQPSPNSSSCVKCDSLQRTFEQEREQRLQMEKDYTRLRDVVTRQRQQQEELNRSLQQQQQENEQMRYQTNQDRRSEAERVKHELERLRHDLDQLVSQYEPSSNVQQQRAQLHSQIENMRQFYENEYQQGNQALPRALKENRPMSSYHSRGESYTKTEYMSNGSIHDSHCLNSRLLKERLENAIDASLAEQRIKTLKELPILPRQTISMSTNHLNTTSSYDPLRKRYFL